MSFLFPSLLAIGLPLAAVPVLLHLLNLRRQRRVEWAAMEYLLESNQRNRHWINLRQWLLLAARVALVCLAAVMLAGPRIAGGLAGSFAADRVHHLIVIDDSFSMADRGQRTAAWESVLAATRHIVARAMKSPEHAVSVLLASRCRAASAAEPIRAAGRSELAGLAEKIRALKPSETAVPLGPAIEAASRLAQSGPTGDPTIAYVLSDFRSRDVKPADPLLASLEPLAEVAGATHLIPCVSVTSENLAVTALRLLPGARVAGIELTAEVEVANYGRRAANRVTVQLERDGAPLPAADLGEIPPQESRTCRFSVLMQGAGEHTLRARIEDDALPTDNQRFFATKLPDSRDVLIVDGSPGESEGLVYSAALRPAGVSTGWAPKRIEPADLPAEGDLSSYAAVLLLDAPKLSPPTVDRLVEYRDDGGGVFLSLGSSVDQRSYNRRAFGNDGELLRVKLDLPTQLAPLSGASATRTGVADLRVGKHPLFRVFAGDRNSFLQLISVNYFHGISLPRGGRQKTLRKRGVRAIASLRGGSPLLLERVDGSGRTLALLTTVARPPNALEGWSDLGNSPVFPVLANELAAYLAAPGLEEPGAVVGKNWRGSGVFEQRGEDAETWIATPVTADFADLRIMAAAGGPIESGPIEEVGSPPERQGWSRVGPAADLTRGSLVAVNVDTAESDLTLPESNWLAEQFAGAGVRVTPVAELLRRSDEPTHASLARWLAVAALLLLLAEQLLGLQCSYHSPPPARRAA